MGRPACFWRQFPTLSYRFSDEVLFFVSKGWQNRLPLVLNYANVPLVRAVSLSYLTRRPALRGQRARWSGWPASR